MIVKKKVRGRGGMKGKIFIKILVCLLFITLTTTAFAFGPDVEIVPTSKGIATFDADYNLNTGEMYVAVRIGLEKQIRLYKSSDHGLHWDLVKKISTICGSGTTEYLTAPVKLIYSENFDRLFLFYPTSNKKLCVKRIYPLNGQTLYSKQLNIPFDINWSNEASLSVTQNLITGRLYAYVLEGVHSGDKFYLCHSDNGFDWTCNEEGHWGKGGSLYNSIAYGPPNNLWIALSTYYFSTSPNPSSNDLEIIFRGHYPLRTKRITSNSFQDWKPIVVQSNKDNGTVWVFFTQRRSTNVYYVKYAYSTDNGQHWHINWLANGYTADAKFYKAHGNGYVDAVYVGADGHLYWTWAHDSSPSNWHAKTKISDQRVNYGWFAKPVVIYSPGASKPGGGAIFAYYDHIHHRSQGLFFDAPWITASVTQHTLSLSVLGNGTVISDDGKINCPGDCTEDYDEGTTVTLNAQASTGYEVQAWGGDCSSCTGNSCQIQMDSDKSCSVTFVQTPTPKHTLSLSISGNGTVTSSPSGISCPDTCSFDFDEGIDVTLTATPPAENYTISWKGDCDSCNGTDCTITMDADKTCSVIFEMQETGVPLPTSPTLRTISPADSWLSLGTDAEDGILSPTESISVIANIPKFAGPVDLYAAIQVPGLPLILINESNQFVLFPDAGIVPFRTNITGPETTTLLPAVPIVNPLTNQCLLPEGQYVVYTLILPAGTDIMSVDWQHDPYLLEYYFVQLNCQ